MATKSKTSGGKSTLPKDLESAMQKALTALEAGHSAAAATAFEELAAKASDAGQVAVERVARGYAGAARAKSAKAVAVKEDPLTQLSRLLNEGESEEALQEAEKATKANDKSAALQYLKASAMAQMGRYEESAEALRKAMALNPDFAWTFRLEPDFARARASSWFAAFERGD